MISDGALVAITLMIAESDPKRKRHHDDDGYEFVNCVNLNIVIF